MKQFSIKTMIRPINLLAAILFLSCILPNENNFIFHHVNGFSQFVISPLSCTQSRSVDRTRLRSVESPDPLMNPWRRSYWALHSQAAADSDSILKGSKLTEQEIDESMDYLAKLINFQLGPVKNPIVDITATNAENEQASTTNNDEDLTAYQLAKGRFVDLATTLQGEQSLENIFLPQQSTPPPDIHIVQNAITSLQSLLIYGMQIGVKGSEEMQKKTVRHLFRAGDPPQEDVGTWIPHWNSDSIRRLKLYRDTRLGTYVLSKLLRKRSAQGAFDLLVDMGVWRKYEDTALLRSGFPTRFLESETIVAKDAEMSTHDPDGILGIRRDLRHHKIYTIDSASTADIDDGISVEVLDGDNDGENKPSRNRYWIHIADVDRWAPRGSELLKVAERRGTSLYLPTMTLCMFPEIMSSGAMSLQSMEDKCALSLGVELNSDGSIDPSSIIMTPSLIHVDYRLTYDQVDEMLDEGVGYTEEWQIGAMLGAATKRRAHRVGRGSTEGMVPFPIPNGMVSATYNDETKEHDVTLKIETTHNSGANMTAGDKGGIFEEHYDPYCSTVSSSQLIVTEMMILAGEAIGKWQKLQAMQSDTSLDGCTQLPNLLELPFRRQPGPEFKSRQRESSQMDFLFSMNKRYPHAWYARRFFNKVTVSEEPGPHFGMGLDCYVQWSSPIRRITDLKVHAAVKRYLRRKRVNEMLQKGLPIPSEVSSMDLGYDVSKIQQTENMDDIDPIDYRAGLGMIFAARPVQSSSSNYWLFEYIRQLVDKSDGEVMFESIVLGCVNQDRFQYAIYVYELGLEYRYLSETGKLEEGKRLWLKVSSVNPKMELLSFSLASRSGGIHAQQSSAPAA
eukprot:CAMPEP_0172314286 /NCGR_PEP_ID=MMETSP1058-20130122/22162_1 /TAXON_ID=83371 /ORGANISM="Detonula confervacea, Strain CCMP 353" /LENGTH=844 /DNA_ID=CAMNT_0013028113 /DNA_START=16 /DNA_END=2550 /DNA_ORIENTATION=+